LLLTTFVLAKYFNFILPPPPFRFIVQWRNILQLAMFHKNALNIYVHDGQGIQCDKEPDDLLINNEIMLILNSISPFVH
jgi:hypothetical protein